jgi:hypothetical protein
VSYAYGRSVFRSIVSVETRDVLPEDAAMVEISALAPAVEAVEAYEFLSDGDRGI